MEVVMMIMIILYSIAIAIAATLILYGILTLIKWFVTRRNSNIVVHAIFNYHMHVLNDSQLGWDNVNVMYSDMRDWNDVLSDWRSWSYKDFLPPEKYIIVSPFIDPKYKKKKRKK